MKDIYVVGIAGGSASGKTSVCEELIGELRGIDTEEIHMDFYFKRFKLSQKSNFSFSQAYRSKR